jgi:hypothetical protein
MNRTRPSTPPAAKWARWFGDGIVDYLRLRETEDFPIADSPARTPKASIARSSPSLF